MKDIFFSIVIPAYNAAESIATTLDCVAAQTYQHFEIIIIDDKSSDADKLAEVVQAEKYSHLQMRLVFSEEKLFGSAARNKGVKLATGDYICFLDADDEWHQDKLKESLNTIIELEAQGRQKTIIYSQVNIIQDGQFLKVMPMQPVKKTETVAEYLFGCYGFIQTSTIVLKREYALDIQFDPKYIRHQDYDFCIRADKKGYEFVMIDRPLADYHLVSNFGSKHKGESVKYSFFWLENMKPWLTQRDINTYKAYKLPLRYKMDGKSVKATLSFVRYFFLTNAENRTYFINRLKDKIRTRLGGK
ncbi:glycosyltransferase family 2 protein [Erwinia psidii]|uniref:Glycosyltransferase family 2 protein n=1 Tax=Erwinia psidii TaxID=69224 RepID=A0A3N6S2J8_9GAMM|nr:glycosyltransferase family 2 protein [Erwinia psidii]MCX8956463.1 glycosyltransferase family 2 protein [Erwinia psidii]MCX8962309.1 glycosyltransferase family 2 protein [Erwinia psidii]MCX8965854.1 glycosyltransferase family 2 protein [Erwinia psidii]RQM39794.1 glycosyltransferase family 2 protein [Erwinia psidii]